jgi:hypothetical protein
MWNRGCKKYGNKKVERDGYSFSSKLEAGVYGLLKQRALAGQIEIQKLQDTIYLGVERFIYKPDFKCLDKQSGEVFWVEAKGFQTETWRRNYRIWKLRGPGKLEIWKGTAARPVLAEVLIPKNDVCSTCGRKYE